MKRIDTILSGLPQLHEAALMLSTSNHEQLCLRTALEGQEVIKTGNWYETGITLQRGQSAYLLLEEAFSEELLDLISQFQRRGGFLQIMDRLSLELIPFHYNPDAVSLILLCRQSVFAQIIQHNRLLEAIGPIFYTQELLCPH